MITTLEQNLAWAQRHMRVTQALLAATPALKGVQLACSIHLYGNSHQLGGANSRYTVLMVGQKSI